MKDKIELEIVTPRGRALSLSVDEVAGPSVEGEFGVLPGHLPLLAAMRTGIVTYRQGGQTRRCAIGPGFAQAGPEKMVILTSEFTERAQIDPVLVRKEMAEIQLKLAKLEAVPLVAPGTTGADAASVDARLERDGWIARENWLAAQLELYGDPAPATQRPYEEFGPPVVPPDDDSATGAQGPQLPPESP
jgi:F-type H+-transporting ATPase subunit epsilon